MHCFYRRVRMQYAVTAEAISMKARPMFIISFLLNLVPIVYIAYGMAIIIDILSNIPPILTNGFI